MPAGTPSSTRQPSSMSFSDGAWSDDVERPLDARSEIERLLLQIEPARLDLRVVEDVVDHMQQRVPARAHDLGELALLGRQICVEQEAGHADHRIHRRPDLMAHGGEECALRLRSRLRLHTRMLEIGDVTRSLDRRCGERGKGLGHVGVLRRVEVRFERVERQPAHQPITDEQRDGHPSLDPSPAVGLLVEVLEPRRDVRDDDRLESLDHLAGRIVGPPPVEALSEQFAQVRKAVAADDHHLVALELLDAGSPIRHDLAQLGKDQIDDHGQIHGAAQRFGCRP